jgi:DNA-binding transcriptional regulator YiaG
MVDFMKVLAALNPAIARAQAPVPEKVPVRALRRQLGLSLEGFARRYGFPPGTLRHWEEGRRQPDAAACAYLTVIARDPKRVAAIFRGASADDLTQLTLRELAASLEAAERRDEAARSLRKARRSPARSPAPEPSPPASPAAPAASQNPDR